MPRRAVAVIVTAALAGLVARAWLLDLAPRYGFTGDHVDYVCWGREAVDRWSPAIPSPPK